MRVIFSGMRTIPKVPVRTVCLIMVTYKTSCWLRKMLSFLSTCITIHLQQVAQWQVSIFVFEPRWLDTALSGWQSYHQSWRAGESPLQLETLFCVSWPATVGQKPGWIQHFRSVYVSCWILLWRDLSTGEWYLRILAALKKSGAVVDIDLSFQGVPDDCIRDIRPGASCIHRIFEALNWLDPCWKLLNNIS